MKTRIRTEAAALWQIAWPVLIGQLATVGMGVSDVAMTGHLSAQELAAVSLGASFRCGADCLPDPQCSDIDF